MARLLIVALVACWSAPPKLAAPPQEPLPRETEQMPDPQTCARFDANDPTCKERCPRDAPKEWIGCTTLAAQLVAEGYACTRPHPRDCTPPAWPKNVCPTGCQPLTARILKLEVSSGSVTITLSAGSELGVTKTWRGAVMNGDVRVPGGAVTLVRVDRAVSVGTVTLSATQLQGRTVLLEP